MIDLHNKLIDRFLTSVPGSLMDEADQFVRELRFMCNEHILTCPIVVYKDVPVAKQPSTFFRSKNRHRTGNETGSILNQALQQERAFEKGLDVSAVAPGQDACAVFLPDAFKLTFSQATLQQFIDSSQYVDEKLLAELAYTSDISLLSESAQHIIAHNVPFYYCIRL